jgi:outer membrane protein OmpA-like peptidoglycan-associated protein
MTPREKEYTAIGAAAGGLAGGGAGCALGLEADEDDSLVVGVGCGVGFLVGAVVGGTIGYLEASEPPPAIPPPPPPPPPLPPPPAPPPVKQKLVLRGVHFDFNKSNIRPGDAAVLDEAASTLKANPNVAVDVNGYCDAIGGVEYNLRLSDRRANSVVDYLVKDGIPESRLIPHGYGKTDFVAPNETDEGRAQNRRVELAPR